MLNKEIHAAFSIGSKKLCWLAKACGSRCVLRMKDPSPNPPLGEKDIASMIEELFLGPYANTIFSAAVNDEEPLEHPGMLQYALKLFYRGNRVSYFGFVTSGKQVDQWTARYRIKGKPFSFIAFSWDRASTGLHVEPRCEEALFELLELKKYGGTERLVVNTLFTKDNMEEVVALGRTLDTLAHNGLSAPINQWTVGPLLEKKNGRLVPSVSVQDIKRMRDLLVKNFPRSKQFPAMSVLLETPYREHHQLTRKPAPLYFRSHHKIGDSRVILGAHTDVHGYFFQVNGKGEIDDIETFAKTSVNPAYGLYTKNKLNKLLKGLVQVRKQARST